MAIRATALSGPSASVTRMRHGSQERDAVLTAETDRLSPVVQVGGTGPVIG